MATIILILDKLRNEMDSDLEVILSARLDTTIRFMDTLMHERWQNFVP